MNSSYLIKKSFRVRSFNVGTTAKLRFSLISPHLTSIFTNFKVIGRHNKIVKILKKSKLTNRGYPPRYTTKFYTVSY